MDMEKWIALVKSGEIEAYLNILTWFLYAPLKETHGVCEWATLIWPSCYYPALVSMMHDASI